MWVEPSKSQLTDDKPPLKWAWTSKWASNLNFGTPNHTSRKTEARVIKFGTQAGYIKCYQ